MIWSDEFRPTTWGEYVGRKTFVGTMQEFLKDPESMPHLGFEGGKGSGKTTAVYVMAGIMVENGDAEFLEFNTMYDKNQAFVENLGRDIARPPTHAKIRFIMIDEVSEMSKKAQFSLRALLELEHPYNRFVLIWNNPTQMVETLVDRTAFFKFFAYEISEICEVLEKICDAKQLIAPDDMLLLIAKRSDGSMRRSINLLQKYTRAGMIEVPLEEESDSIIKLFEEFWSGNFNEGWKTYLEYQKKGRSIREIPSILVTTIEGKFKENWDLKAVLSGSIIILARDIAQGIEPDVAFYGFLGSIYHLIQKIKK